MTDAQPDTKALPMWLVSNQFAIHPMMAYSPGPPGTVPMPYFAGQSSVPGMGHSLPNTAGGKNKKRKRTDTISGNSGNDLNITNSHGVIKQEVPEDAAVKIEEEVVIKTEEAPVMNSALPTLRNTMPELITRLPAVMVRNTCRVCGKLFRSGQLLRQHMLVHTDQRKYQCRYCDRTFKQLSHLQQHHRIHTG